MKNRNNGQSAKYSLVVVAAVINGGATNLSHVWGWKNGGVKLVLWAPHGCCSSLTMEDGKGQAVEVVVRAGAVLGRWAVVEGNGGRGAVREERWRVNTVSKAYWFYMWSINLNL